MIKINPIFAIIVLIATISNFAIEFFVPSLPFIAKSLQNDNIQLAISTYLIGAGTGQLIYGPLSDTYGRKNILLLGLLISMLSTYLCGMTGSANLFLLYRFMQGLGLAACLAMVRSIMRDCYNSTRMAKMYSYLSIFMEGSTLFAPIIGGVIQTFYGWRMNFHFFTLISSLCFVIILFFLPETNKNKLKFNFYTFFLDSRNIASDKNFMIYSLSATLAASGVYIYLSISPFLYENYFNLSPTKYSYTVFAVSAMLILGAALNSRLINYFNLNWLILIGGSCMLSSGLVMLFLMPFTKIHLFFILFPTFLFMLGASLIFPNALAGALNHYALKAGIASSLYGTSQLVGASLFIYLVSYSNQNLPLSLALVYGAFGIIVMLTTSLLSRDVVDESRLNEEMLNS